MIGTSVLLIEKIGNGWLNNVGRTQKEIVKEIVSVGTLGTSEGSGTVRNGSAFNVTKFLFQNV